MNLIFALSWCFVIAHLPHPNTLPSTPFSRADGSQQPGQRQTLPTNRMFQAMISLITMSLLSVKLTILRCGLNQIHCRENLKLKVLLLGTDPTPPSSISSCFHPSLSPLSPQMSACLSVDQLPFDP